MIPFDFMMDAIRAIYANDRYFTYDSMLKTCRTVEALMRKLGMQDVKTLHFTSDGKINHGGWLMPLAWNVRKGILKAILPDGTQKQICSYAETPCSLMLYSYSADITADMTIVTPDADLHGKIALVTDEFPSISRIQELFNRGALAVLGGWLPSVFLGKPHYEFLRDSCQWYNYGLPFWQTGEHHCGFSLTPNQTEYLRQLLEQNGSVKLHIDVDTELKEGTIPLVTGLLPGETDEEILITGHLFEEGADDNASGCAMALGIVKGILESGKKRKRGIRLMFTHEIKSLQAYLNSNPDLPHFIAGLDMDMVGASADGEAHIGDSAPVFPNYAVCLLKHLLEVNGFTGLLRGINAMDTHFSDTEYQVPMTYLDFYNVPNYHKSTDTPDTISQQMLESTYKVTYQYITFLVSTGLQEACELRDIVLDFSRKRIESFRENESAGIPTPSSAAAIAKARLESILPLVEAENKETFQKSLSPFFEKLEQLCDYPDSTERKKLKADQKKRLDSLICKKAFHGFCSFEKYMMDSEKYPELASLVKGWEVPLWLDYALMWADGHSRLSEIWEKLQQNGLEADPDLLYTVFQLFIREGYVRRIIPEAEISEHCFDVAQGDRKELNREDPIFTSGKIFEEALRKLGVFPGIRMVVHSSLSSFGTFEGGAENVCRVLCNVVSEEGTLMMPGLVKYPSDGEELIYNPEETPASVGGKIPDTFRHLPGVVRSLDPTHSFCVWGKDKMEFIREHHRIPTMHERSPLGLLEKADGYCLLMGCRHPVTFMHVVETSCGASCFGSRTEEYPAIIQGKKVKLRGWSWRNGVCRAFHPEKIVESLRSHHWLSELMVGRCHLVLFKLSDYRKAYSQFLLDPESGCKNCPVRPRQVKQTVPSDWDADKDQWIPSDAFVDDVFEGRTLI